MRSISSRTRRSAASRTALPYGFVYRVGQSPDARSHRASHPTRRGAEEQDRKMGSPVPRQAARRTHRTTTATLTPLPRPTLDDTEFESWAGVAPATWTGCPEFVTISRIPRARQLLHSRRRRGRRHRHSNGRGLCSWRQTLRRGDRGESPPADDGGVEAGASVAEPRPPLARLESKDVRMRDGPPGVSRTRAITSCGSNGLTSTPSQPTSRARKRDRRARRLQPAGGPGCARDARTFHERRDLVAVVFRHPDIRGG